MNGRLPEEDRLPVGLRSLAVIETLVQAGTPLTATSINERLNLPTATIHRICQRLVASGWLAMDARDRRLAPGGRLRRFAAGLTAFATFAHARIAILRRLSETIGETCNITVPDREGMVYLDRVETRWPLRIQFPVGVVVPFHCSASGKLYLSSLRKRSREKTVRALTLEQRAPNTITDPDALLHALAAIRAERLGTDNEELVEGMAAVAVPIQDEAARLVATLAVHGPTRRMSLDDARAHVPALREAAAELQAVFLDAGTAGAGAG